MLYKHTILPFLEYAAFMILACNIDDRRDLQKCQNDALMICVRVSLKDRVRLDELHAKFKIVSLEVKNSEIRLKHENLHTWILVT